MLSWGGRGAYRWKWKVEDGDWALVVGVTGEQQKLEVGWWSLERGVDRWRMEVGVWS